MKTKVYGYRSGARISGVPPEVAGNELERIRAVKGSLVPTDVVNEARPEDAPLHPAFEWDDGVAAEQFRQQQARQLIRAVCVKSEDGENLDPVYVHVRTDDGGAYQDVEVVAKEPDLLASAIEELTEKLASARRSLDQLRRAANAAKAKVNSSKVKAVGKHLDAAEKASASIL